MNAGISGLDTTTDCMAHPLTMLMLLLLSLKGSH